MLLAAASAAQAAVVLDGPREGSATLPAGPEAEVVSEVPFHFDADGQFYAKLLVTPWNAVNNGTANGTAGASGWWISFTLRDATGATTNLGAFNDSTPTPFVPLSAGSPRTLVTRIHMPAVASKAGASYRVAFALVFHEGSGGGDGTSGATLDQSRSFTQTILVEGPPGTPTPTPAPGPTPPAGNTTNETTPNGTTPSPLPPTPPTPSPPAPTGNAGSEPWLWVFALLALVVLGLGVFFLMQRRRPATAPPPASPPPHAPAPPPAPPPTPSAPHPAPPHRPPIVTKPVPKQPPEPHRTAPKKKGP